MVLKTIHLELARCPDHPEGSANYGYVFRAPLDGEGHVDPLAWRKERTQCTVRRFAPRESDEHGHLVHRRNGWAFHYDGTEPEDDEVLFQFEHHRFVEGEYVSIKEWDGMTRTFRITRVH